MGRRWVVEVMPDPLQRSPVFVPAEGRGIDPNLGVSVNYAKLFLTKKVATAEAKSRGFDIVEVVRKWW